MYIFLAMVAGGTLSFMLHLNSTLAKFSTPLWSSLVAHTVGTIAGIFLFLKIRFPSMKKLRSAPWWAYCGGVLGALIVFLINKAVMGPTGLSGTLALSLLGQLTFGIIADSLGLFGLTKRKIGLLDILQIACVMSGAFIIIFGAQKSV